MRWLSNGPHAALGSHRSQRRLGLAPSNATTALLSEPDEAPAVSKSNGSLAPSEQQAPIDHHSIDGKSGDSCEPHRLRCAALSGASTRSRPESASVSQQQLAGDLNQPPNVEQPPAVQKSFATQQWISDCSNLHKGGGKIKQKVSKTNTRQRADQMDNMEVNSQLETLVSKHVPT